MKTDVELQREILAELAWQPNVNPAHIGVTVKDGVVTLAGHVPSYSEKYAAERAVKSIYGVAGVANELIVKLQGASQRGDEDIAQAAVSALRSNVLVPPEAIKTIVKSGWITLEGEVEWQYQKEAAERAVRHLNGVIGVTNSVVVKPRLSPADIKGKIEEAFRRNAEMDARRTTVEVKDGTVILRGNVRSWTEKEEAERVVWRAPGVQNVENLIIVTP